LRFSRRAVLSSLLGASSLLVISVKKIFDYGGAPDKEKESDFVFPSNPVQEQPTDVIAESPSITFR